MLLLPFLNVKAELDDKMKSPLFKRSLPFPMPEMTPPVTRMYFMVVVVVVAVIKTVIKTKTK